MAKAVPPNHNQLLGGRRIGSGVNRRKGVYMGLSSVAFNKKQSVFGGTSFSTYEDSNIENDPSNLSEEISGPFNPIPQK